MNEESNNNNKLFIQSIPSINLNIKKISLNIKKKKISLKVKREWD